MVNFVLSEICRKDRILVQQFTNRVESLAGPSETSVADAARGVVNLADILTDGGRVSCPGENEVLQAIQKMLHGVDKRYLGYQNSANENQSF